MDQIPNLRNALDACIAVPITSIAFGDQRDMCIDSLRSIIDYCEAAMPHGDMTFPEQVGSDVLRHVQAGDIEQAMFAALNGRFTIAEAANAEEWEAQ
jgi:hypothetical protein